MTMIDIKDLKKGDILHDVQWVAMGNTTLREDHHWEVYVRKVGSDHDGAWADMSWNGNTSKRYRLVPAGFKRWPKEWLLREFGSRMCVICRGREDRGHVNDCEHPRAIRARKKAQG